MQPTKMSCIHYNLHFVSTFDQHAAHEHDTFSRLSEDESNDYDVVKRALLKRYKLTSEGFNLKFRSSRPELGERMSQFKTRLESYLDRWMELSERDLGSSEHWKDLMLYEQLLNSCGRDLRTFLMERKPRSCSELIVLAEQYIEAQGESKHFSKKRQKQTTLTDRSVIFVVRVAIDQKIVSAGGAQKPATAAKMRRM